tara:strand:- start:184 stop:525 length:342 start_codon:yes stop_codon:yes gene_type:complete
MVKKILFISKNYTVALKFKKFIQHHTRYKCDIVKDKYCFDKLDVNKLRIYKKIIIHSDRGSDFPTASRINKLYKKYPIEDKYILYKYGPFYPSDMFSSYYSNVIIRRLYSLSP